MSKRILSIMLVVLMCLSLFPLAAAAAGNVEATYADGVVTVKGTGFTGGTDYTVRVVDTVNSNVQAMGQAIANGSGEISISITAGVLGTVANYTVYINKPDGTLAGSDTSIEARKTSGGVPTPAVIPTPIETSSSNNGSTTTVSASVKTTADSATGTANAQIDKSTLDSLTEKAKEAEASGQKAVIEIKMESAAGQKAVEVEIPRDAFNHMADTTSTDLKIDAGIGSITLDAKALESISSDATAGNITINIARIDTSALTPEVQEKIGDRPVYDFAVRAGSTEISTFNGGKVSVSIPYTLKPGEDGDSVVVYYIDSSGMLNPVRGRYDSSTGTVNFTTPHLSRYAVGYNKVSFSDVKKTAWYGKAIGFMAARGIIKGMGGDRFAPEVKVTRADFLIMVMNSYGIALDATITDNFSDAGNKYYTPYLAKAKGIGLTSGTGDNKYMPEAAISRQDMFVILYGVLKKLDGLPEGTVGKSLGSFNDAGDIATYSREAVKLFIETGTISGDGKNLNPRDGTTRAQAAQVLYNLLSK